MEKNLAKVPFETGLAKKITNGEVEGRIVTRDGRIVRIVCFDAIREDKLVVLVPEGRIEKTYNYTPDGRVFLNNNSPLDLMLEIPEYMTFKDGDIIKLSNDTYIWLSIIKDIDLSDDGRGGLLYFTNDYVSILINDGDASVDIDTYSDAGTNVEKATEEEKQILIEALKLSKEPKAKEYLKRFFPDHSNSSNIGKDCEFKPKDWVLTREGIEDRWCLNIFSHRVWDEDEKCYLYYCVGGWDYECIPYNEQTAHLLGTIESYESYEIQITNLHYQKAVGKIACTGDKA